jgi:hypothetical protein
MDSIKLSMHSKSAARDAFNQFLDGIQVLRPDGGERCFSACVSVQEGPNGKGYVTVVTVQEGGNLILRMETRGH